MDLIEQVVLRREGFGDERHGRFQLDDRSSEQIHRQFGFVWIVAAAITAFDLQDLSGPLQ